MIRFSDVSITQGEFRLQGITFSVGNGEYAVLMGHTGSGKTTLLECLCGLRIPDSGTIELQGRDITRLRPAERGIGYVPQDGALFSTMTVRQQLEFPLRIRTYPPSEIAERTAWWAERLGLDQLLDRRPAGLSGGERQRVALGRALIFEPEVLALDEPLSALDESVREQMCSLLKRVQGETKVTVLHITHSHREAQSVATQILTIEQGGVVETTAQRADRQAIAAESGNGPEELQMPRKELPNS